MKKTEARGQETGDRKGRQLTYKRAGVNIRAADAWLHGMRRLIRSTQGAGVLPDLGQFAGLFQLNGQLREPVLVASTDGVGTKLKIAQLADKHQGIGVDVVAMNVNDILTYGARPLFFLDYLAMGRLMPSVMSPLLRGVVAGCRESGCALLGGETAEMPGVYGAGEYDIAGFCVGVAERSRLIDGSQVRGGDVIVGLASSGVHSNGLALVRKVFTKTQLLRHSRQLLIPTRIYVKPVLAALEQVRVNAIAHVTGGGLSRRIPSLVLRARGVRALLRPGSWPVPAIFRTIQEAGRLSEPVMMSTFNMGIGMALVCRRRDAGRLVQLMIRARVPAWIIGAIERTS
ncbi:MAG: phosphoribosylformylglycinamidine cyclo-ligase [Candidatus Omnitrophica bacterium]|nr:phosphoribosylformylglycinamidine cyclo-ligase [Candidatus Omnitrophota bacterium]